jgi:hypothetical protein
LLNILNIVLTAGKVKSPAYNYRDETPIFAHPENPGKIKCL